MSTVPHDELFGLLAVANFIDRTEAETLALIDAGRLPFSLAGKMILGSKTALREWLAQQEPADDWRGTGPGRRT